MMVTDPRIDTGLDHNPSFEILIENVVPESVTMG